VISISRVAIDPWRPKAGGAARRDARDQRARPGHEWNSDSVLLARLPDNTCWSSTGNLNQRPRRSIGHRWTITADFRG
jgi:hypothetical protein